MESPSFTFNAKVSRDTSRCKKSQFPLNVAAKPRHV